MQYIILFVAVVMETIGTTALQSSQQFTRLWPTLIAIVAYMGAFYFLGLTLKFMPVGIVYALWSGLGIVTITIIGFVIFRAAVRCSRYCWINPHYCGHCGHSDVFQHH